MAITYAIAHCSYTTFVEINKSLDIKFNQYVSILNAEMKTFIF